MPELITPSEYARRRGVSHSAVAKAIAKGRISTILGENGRPMIDPKVADIQWAQNTDPQQSARANAPKGDRGRPADGGGGMDGDVGNGAAYWNARTKREHAEAEMAEMKRRQMAGELVERSRVQAAAFTYGRLIRDSVLGVPVRLAPELVRLTDAWEIEQRIAEALRLVLEDVAKMNKADLERALGQWNGSIG